jgi:hypothetical protein
MVDYISNADRDCKDSKCDLKKEKKKDKKEKKENASTKTITTTQYKMFRPICKIRMRKMHYKA